ncbi:hypothetical protein [Oceanicoccus sagamiensis]|uniref:Uncharacterized protein n=1 Tax=Oceanicoccus sagamiensis TaxID=716816 RepID=A0A1X9N7E8_9GAMM|nr:hypothetical protein [Oceanicoccus sagamiensis]ARN73054.1 hypothetical protein BST96_02375 [Oceanicoccus sagamiensis]
MKTNPNSDTIETSWAEIISITQSIENSAAKEAWEDISSLAVNRHKKITGHFAQFPVGPDTAYFYAEHLNNFIAQEQVLSDLVKAARKEALKQGMTINNRKKVNSAYLK